jgi:hypothetical protein
MPMHTIADIHQQNLAACRQRQFAANIAHYLRLAPLPELAQLVGALAAECGDRGIQVAEPLGLVAARLEYCAECCAGAGRHGA